MGLQVHEITDPALRAEAEKHAKEHMAARGGKVPRAPALEPVPEESEPPKTRRRVTIPAENVNQIPTSPHSAPPLAGPPQAAPVMQAALVMQAPQAMPAPQPILTRGPVTPP